MGEHLTATGVPPGWYADPWRQSTWRWWSGVEWTPYTDQWPAPVDGDRRPLRAGGIAILGFLVGLGLSTLVGIALLLSGFDDSDPAFLLGAQLGLWVGMFGACVVAVRVKGSGSLADLGLVRPRWADAGLGLAFAIAGIIMVVSLAAILQAIDSDLLPGGRSDLTDPVDRGGALGVVVLYLIAVVGAPFVEELYFRGLVQGTLSARWGVAVGLIVQALLFGVVHLVPDNGLGNVGTYVVITAVGLGLGGIRLLSKRQPPGMFAHAGYNAIIVTIALAVDDVDAGIVGNLVGKIF